MSTTRTFRSPDQWQAIINEFAASGLSAPSFCKQQNLPYGSFAKWRQKLANTSGHKRSNPALASASFLDLSALSSEHASSNWRITLKLGNGVELVLSQA